MVKRLPNLDLTLCLGIVRQLMKKTQIDPGAENTKPNDTNGLFLRNDKQGIRKT